MKSITLCKSPDLCSKCGGNMITKGHSPEDIKVKNQKQYYTQWDYCLSCRTIWYDPKYCVINERRKSDIQEYFSEMNSLFKNL